MIKHVRKTNRKFDSKKIESRRPARLIRPSRKFEGMSSDDREIGERLDAICEKHQDLELERMSDVRKVLKEIEKDARKLGFALEVNNHSVDEFCDMYDLEDDEYLEIFWIDGEPGDEWALVSRSFDDEDKLELAGDFYFDEI